MLNSFKKFFTSDKVMLWNMVLAWIAAFIYYFSFRSLVEDPVHANNTMLHIIENFIMVAILTITVISYYRHDKNIMKCTMGAALMMFVLRFLNLTIYEGAQFFYIFPLINCSLIFITHLWINSERKSNPARVFINQLVMAVFMIYCFIYALYGLTYHKPLTISFMFMAIFSMNIVVCIESKLDAFRIAREAKGWKEK